MNEPGGPGRGDPPEAEAEVEFAEHAEHAEHAEFAEFAEHAEFAEFAEHAERPVTEARSHPHAPHLPHHVGADGLTDEHWRSELAHLVRAASHLQEAGTRRLRRPDRPEPRWPVTLTVILAVVLQLILPTGLGLRPRYLLPALEVGLLIGLSVANPVRIERHSRSIRAASVALILLITAANAISAGLLIKEIVTATVPGGGNAAVNLLVTGAAVWGTNVIAFALWYWEFDRGGPVHRLEMINPYPDLLFPQMMTPELTPPGWGPRFTDYLYLSFTNATAFSPTDTMPMARWAKLTMLVQSAVSLAVGALVIARAVNILH